MAILREEMALLLQLALSDRGLQENWLLRRVDAFQGFFSELATKRDVKL